MLIASEKKKEKVLFNTVDYVHETKNKKGEADKIVCSVGFYEIEKKDKDGKILTDHFVATRDHRHFEKVPYSGKTLMISVRTSKFSTAVRVATEEDKVKFKKAYETFLEAKAIEDAKEKEMQEMQEKLKALEEKEAKKALKEEKEAKKS